MNFFFFIMSELKCVCGRICLNIQGFGSHQRACTTYQAHAKKLKQAAKRAKTPQTAPSSPVQTPRTIISLTSDLASQSEHEESFIENLILPKKPNEAKPNEAKPNEAKPNEAKPNKPNEVKPKETELKPKKELKINTKLTGKKINSPRTALPIMETNTPIATQEPKTLRSIMSEGSPGLEILNGCLLRSNKGFTVLGDPDMTELIYYTYRNIDFTNKNFLDMNIPERPTHLASIIKIKRLQERMAELESLRTSILNEINNELNKLAIQ